MTPERWNQLDALFNEALELEGDARALYIAKACNGNDRLREDAEQLIAAHEQDGSFLETPIFVEYTGFYKNDDLLDPAGRWIGPYQIIKLLGRGGMGEVFLAWDARLERKVAIKLLSDAFTRIQDRVRRFEREAKAVSALNHPNILTIHEIGETSPEDGGVHYIVCEFVEGDTLRQRMQRGGVGFEEAVVIAEQISGALNAAHQAGVVHRDIKPENVMLRPDALVKILDFGLAKLTERPKGIEIEHILNRTPSLSSTLTESGVVMGTISYMSPEQARGLEVDHRTDIFSVGVVLYEMIAGRRPFEAATTGDLIASLLTTEPPPLNQYCAGVPAEAERIIQKCLAKDREARCQSADELQRDLHALRIELKDRTTAAAAKRRFDAGILVRRKLLIATTALLAITSLVAVLFLRSKPTIETSFPEKQRLAGPPTRNAIAYDNYLRGNFYLAKSGKDNAVTALKMFEQAVLHDPSFALGHFGVAHASQLIFFRLDGDKKYEERAFVALENALTLDPNLAEGYVLRANLIWTLANGFPHERAYREHQRALAINPNLASAHRSMAAHIIHIGLFDQALPRSIACDPIRNFSF